MPKIVDHDLRREQIVQAMTEIIIRDGFEAVTMREIAAEAGYAHGAIARYFPNKRTLLMAAFQTLHQGLHERVVNDTRGLRGLTAIEAICRQTFPFGDAGRREAKVVVAFWDRASHDEEFSTIHRENAIRWRGLFRTHLDEAKDDLGVQADWDTAPIVDQMSTQTLGWNLLAAVAPDLATDEIMDRALTAMLSGIRVLRAAK